MPDTHNTTETFENMLKTKYGEPYMKVILEEYILQRMMPFRKGNGLDYKLPVITRLEHGITHKKPRGGKFPLMPARASAIPAAYVEGFQTMLKTSVDLETLARSVSGRGDLAYESQQRRLMQAMADSMRRRQEISAWRGQQAVGIVKGVVGTEVELESDDWILGAFYGMENALISFLNPGTMTLRGTTPNPDDIAFIESGSAAIEKVNTATKKITVNAVPGGVAPGDWVIFASAHNSTEWNEAFGFVSAARTNSGPLYQLSVDDHSVWKPAQFSFLDNLGQRQVPTFRLIQLMNIEGVNNGVGDDVINFVSPHHFVALLDEQASLRRFGGHMSGRVKFDNGANTLVFYSTNGQIRIKPTRFCSNGEVLQAPVAKNGRQLKNWMRIGATEPTFNVPGFGNKNLHIPDAEAGVSLRSYTHQAPFCRMPGHLVYGSGAKAPAA